MDFLPCNHPILYNTDSLNVKHVCEYSEGLTPSDSPAHTGHTCTYHTNTHSQVPGPTPLRTLSATSDTECHGDISQPRWHGDPPSPCQVTLARPSAHTGNMSVGVYSVYVCVWACLSGTCPNLMAQCHCPPTIWQSVFSFHFFPVTLLIFFNYLEHFLSIFYVATQESYTAESRHKF